MSEAEPRILAIVRSAALRDALSAADRFDIQLHDGKFETAESAVGLVANAYPALVIVELGEDSVPWLSLVRSDPATRRLPAIAIGSSDEAVERAKGVRMALYAPEQFTGDVEGVIEQHLRLPNPSADEQLRAQCEKPLPALVLKGLQEFNAGEYFECHETLEHAWKDEQGAVRDVYRAILQVSVAYYQILRGNYQGAQKMFLRSVQWFAPLPDRCHGIDIARLRADVSVVRDHLDTLGAARIAQFDRLLLKPVRYDP